MFGQMYTWFPTFPWTTACSPYTMTFPGADTMKGGIMGEDCLRSMAGLDGTALVLGSSEANCTGIESIGDGVGDWSGVCVACEGVRGLRDPVVVGQRRREAGREYIMPCTLIEAFLSAHASRHGNGKGLGRWNKASGAGAGWLTVSCVYACVVSKVDCNGWSGGVVAPP